MTRLLEQAFVEASKLSEGEQNAIATWLLEELASERRWEKGFSESQAMLASLADEALTEHHQGRTQELDPDNL